MRDQAAISTLCDLINTKQPNLYEHCKRVAEYTLMLADKAGLDESQRQMLYDSAMLHDIGKAEIPDDILNKPGRLTPEEYDVIKQHTIAGYNAIKDINELKSLGPAILHHHERIDGQGYPCGLQGDDIPLLSRILAIADSFDAMTSYRPYKNAMTIQQAAAELRTNSGSQFDSQLVECFLRSSIFNDS
ncbi:HD-GYP domain-containing protein [Mahella australiensis]|uniref:HD-GYP domain-containing protein n=1 Tax=Mahella australiensis TaxID=252966 RepID=UPI0002FD3C03|nr:HD-GYP domain-containing protein [Mahella australiensis]